jgi:hypothetical protein
MPPLIGFARNVGSQVVDIAKGVLVQVASGVKDVVGTVIGGQGVRSPGKETSFEEPVPHGIKKAEKK